MSNVYGREGCSNQNSKAFVRGISLAKWNASQESVLESFQIIDLVSKEGYSSQLVNESFRLSNLVGEGCSIPQCSKSFAGAILLAGRVGVPSGML